MKKILFFCMVMVGTIHVVAIAQPSPTITHLDISNIDATISSSSDLFWDFLDAGCEVPKGSGLNTIFAGGLWIGGLDASNNIRMAAQTYRQTGSDSWAGPIDTVGGLFPADSSWNLSWKVNKSEVLDHIANYANVNYVVPPAIANWPGYNATYQRVLSPFADYNSNGIYDPENGDYPYILGDQTVYSIFNDVGIHTESGCNMMGFEIHRTMFGFDNTSIPELYNSIFSRYEIKNYSDNDYHDVYISLWTDFEIGNGADDYVGTDINLDMVYGYNGDNFDETAIGYGANPPAMGVYFLDHTISTSVSYENVNNSPQGNPMGCIDFYNYLKGIWLDNQPITYGGNGANPGNPVTTLMYPGDTDPIYFPSQGDWSEGTAGNPAGDRRMTGTIGPFTIPAHGLISFDAGYTFAQATTGGPLGSVNELKDAVNSMRIMYDNGLLTGIQSPGIKAEAGFSFYPNPATEKITITNNFTDGKYDVKIVDVMGKTAWEKKYNTATEMSVDLRSFSKGIYLLMITHDKNTTSKKLVVE